MKKVVRFSVSMSVVLTAMGALLSGCGAADSGTASNDVEAAGSEPLAVVKIDDQRVVRFYELPQGGVVITASSEAFAVLAQDEYDLRGTAEEVFGRLRPGEGVPAALKAADARQAMLVEQRLVDVGEFRSEEPEWVEAPAVSSDDATAELVSKDPSDEWFESWACQTSILTHSPNAKQRVPACLVNRTGGGTTAVTGVWEGAGSVFSYRGRVALKTKFRNSGTSTWTEMGLRRFNTGYGGTNWVWNAPEIPMDITFEVDEAEDDGYHRAVVTGTKLNCNSGCFPHLGVCICPV